MGNGRCRRRISGDLFLGHTASSGVHLSSRLTGLGPSASGRASSRGLSVGAKLSASRCGDPVRSHLLHFNPVSLRNFLSRALSQGLQAGHVLLLWLDLPSKTSSTEGQMLRSPMSCIGRPGYSPLNHRTYCVIRASCSRRFSSKFVPATNNPEEGAYVCMIIWWANTAVTTRPSVSQEFLCVWRANFLGLCGISRGETVCVGLVSHR